MNGEKTKMDEEAIENYKEENITIHYQSKHEDYDEPVFELILYRRKLSVFLTYDEIVAVNMLSKTIIGRVIKKEFE